MEVYKQRFPFMTVEAMVYEDDPDMGVSIKLEFFRLDYIKERRGKSRRPMFIRGSIAMKFHLNIFYDLKLGDAHQFFLSRGVPKERVPYLVDVLKELSFSIPVPGPKYVRFFDYFAPEVENRITKTSLPILKDFVFETTKSLLGRIDPEIVSIEVYVTPVIGVWFPSSTNDPNRPKAILATLYVNVFVNVQTPPIEFLSEFPEWWMENGERFVISVFRDKEIIMWELARRTANKFVELFSPQYFTEVWRDALRRLIGTYREAMDKGKMLTKEDEDLIIEYMGEFQEPTVEYHVHPEYTNFSLSKLVPEKGKEDELKEMEMTGSKGVCRINVPRSTWEESLKGAMIEGDAVGFIEALMVCLLFYFEEHGYYFVKGRKDLENSYSDLISNLREILSITRKYQFDREVRERRKW